jgi:hypothetical protein
MSDETPLEMAERHVHEGKRRIASQQRVIEALLSQGLPTDQAQVLLIQFLDLQEMSVAHLKRLRALR